MLTTSLLLALQTLTSVTYAQSDRVEFPFLNRKIRVDPYFDIKTAHTFEIDPDTREIFTLKSVDDRLLLVGQSLPSNAPIDLQNLTPLSGANFSQKNFWGVRRNRNQGGLIVLADENGEERINLYAISSNSDRFRKLTNAGYVYAWGISPDGRKIAYSARSGSAEFSPGSVRVLDLASGLEETVFEDTPETRVFWSDIHWSADGNSFVINMVMNENRNQDEMHLAVRKDGVWSFKRVTKTPGSHMLGNFKYAWVDREHFGYISNHLGGQSAFITDLRGNSRLLTDRRLNVARATVLQAEGRPYAVIQVANPVLDQLIVYDLSGWNHGHARIIFQRDYPADLRIMDSPADAVYFGTNSTTSPSDIFRLEVRQGRVVIQPVAGLAPASIQQAVHCIPEKVSFRTFDDLSAPGENGTLHAWLYRPKNPLPPSQSMLLVEAFYGGSKAFAGTYQILCQMGIHVMSPAPRGSFGWGRDFEKLIEGDHGGNEVLDIIAAARFAQAKLGIPHSRIGAYGGSQGGYTALRALTFPGHVNGQVDHFQWGFGIGLYGYYDLVRSPTTTNIPGRFFQLMGGDPKTNPARWLDRSPEFHANLAQGPILLMHGTNDNRCQIVESRSMAAKLKLVGKPHRLIEIQDEGHGFSSRPGRTQYYRELIRFLEEIQVGRFKSD